MATLKDLADCPTVAVVIGAEARCLVSLGRQATTMDQH